MEVFGKRKLPTLFIKAKPTEKYPTMLLLKFKYAKVLTKGTVSAIQKIVDKMMKLVQKAINAMQDELLRVFLFENIGGSSAGPSRKRTPKLTDVLFVDDGIGFEWHVADELITFYRSGAHLDRQHRTMHTEGYYLKEVRDVTDFAARKVRLNIYWHEDKNKIPTLDPCSFQFGLALSGIVIGVKSVCAVCKKDTKNSCCSGCHRLCYCSKECQVSDWKRHKSTCKLGRPFARSASIST